MFHGRKIQQGQGGLSDQLIPLLYRAVVELDFGNHLFGELVKGIHTIAYMGIHRHFQTHDQDQGTIRKADELPGDGSHSPLHKDFGHS